MKNLIIKQQKRLCFIISFQKFIATWNTYNFFLKKLIMIGVKWHIWTRDLQFIIMGRRCYNLMYKENFYKEMMINLVLIPKFKINAKTKCEVCRS